MSFLSRLLKERQEQRDKYVNKKLEREYKQIELNLELERAEKDKIMLAEKYGRLYVPKGNRVIEHLQWRNGYDR